MTTSVESLSQWIVHAASLIAAGQEPVSEAPPQFLETPTLIPALIKMFAAIDEATLKENQPLYSACLFAIDVCVSQLHFASDNGNRRATQAMDTLMKQLASVIQNGSQSINFWLPVMNAFYETQVKLSPELQDIYLALAEEESEAFQAEGFDHLQSMRDLIKELSDLNTFELAAHFFAQSHAMPVDFFGDLVSDLCRIEEGQDAAILMLLHSDAAVRDIVMFALDAAMETLTLSAVSLSRLRAIQAWFPDSQQHTITHWLREQRKKGGVFAADVPAKLLKAEASEVDGGGAQGVFLQIKDGRATRLAGLLLKEQVGIKDAWITPGITKQEVTNYCKEVLSDGVILRRVDEDYIERMVSHFLALTLQKGNVPGLHFLEFQEALGRHFVPELIDVSRLITELTVQISPFTQHVIDAAFKRSSVWLETKPFAVSWYLEDEAIDRSVNQNCHFAKGTKVCRFEDAMKSVFEANMEPSRRHWIFHFLWVALWLKAAARKNEKTWQDSLLIAHAIQSGMSLSDIPVMQKICHQSVLHSVETMRDRRTHLS